MEKVRPDTEVVVEPGIPATHPLQESTTGTKRRSNSRETSGTLNRALRARSLQRLVSFRFQPIAEP